jgi:hypothetical protein
MEQQGKQQRNDESPALRAGKLQGLAESGGGQGGFRHGIVRKFASRSWVDGAQALKTATGLRCLAAFARAPELTDELKLMR